MHVEAFLRIKNSIIKKERKKVKNKISVCGLSCNHCFLGEWCASCRSEYNCCSYGTLFEKRLCPNVKCAKEKGYDGCYDCPNLDLCEVGFYEPKSDGSKFSKIEAMFIRKHGTKAYVKALDNMHKEYDYAKMQEIIGDCVDGLTLLEEYLNK